MWGDIVIAFLLAFITAYVVTPYTIRFAKKIGALDVPKSNRKIHTQTTPRLGGLAVIAGFMVSVIYLLTVMTIEQRLTLINNDNHHLQLIGFFTGIIVLSIFCFIDDKKGIPPIVKLLGQVLAAVCVASSGVRIEQILPSIFEGFIPSEALSFFITIVWIVGITNAINLIDGLDGLSSGIGVISCLSLLIIFALNDSPLISIILITALAGALLGFMPFNFSHAKTFIGDTGSNFLGYCLAVISILGIAKTYTAVVIIAPLIVFALPLVDTGFAIIRRVIKTRSFKGVFTADRSHLHHRILQCGYTQRQAVFILYGVTASLGMFAIILMESGIYKALSFGLILIAIAAIGYKDIVRIGENKHKID